MKIYLASRYGRRKELLAVKGVIESMNGFYVTARWLETDWDRGDSNQSSHCPADKRSGYAATDLLDIARSDVFVAFSENPAWNKAGSGRGGRHVELGYALGLRMPVYVVGPKENIFHDLMQVVVVDNVQTLLTHLKGL